VLLSVSRLVPRKGMDVLLRAGARLAERHPDLQVVIAGEGRDRPRLERIVDEVSAPARFLGEVPNADLPALYGCADVFAMLCRERWGGLEQEGFGIVFLEAAACGIPQVAGRSGGSHEAVADGETGFVIEHPTDVEEVTAALHQLLADHDLRRRMGAAARQRAVDAFDHDDLAEVLRAGLDAVDLAADRGRHGLTGTLHG
jgi:phosphatidylinositol alpha-1,6-mannosyltransferase